MGQRETPDEREKQCQTEREREGEDEDAGGGTEGWQCRKTVLGRSLGLGYLQKQRAK